ncbi:ATP-binding protein [Streptomyces olivaceoviridis]|uniref:ATP-binding protein n=1 Tax=Streptomyces olivaceoviridis TaxID=1921 RepID=UPI0033B61069
MPTWWRGPAGPPGVGKTMLSVALGRAAADAGRRVCFTTAAGMSRCVTGRRRSAPCAPPTGPAPGPGLLHLLDLRLE